MDFSNCEDYKKIFVFHNSYPNRITSRENSWLEFKESFNWASKSEYVKTMAAFANNKGGFIIFGVKDQPKEIVGLINDNFDKLDEARISGYVNECFSPEIKYEKFIKQIHGKNVGILFIPEAKHKPIICSKNGGAVIKEAEIYYRYHGSSEKIKYSELKLMLDQILEEERKNWREHFEKISKIGPSNAAILDLYKGEIDGNSGTLIMDEKLIPKLKFIKDGVFREGGKPVLKLIGDVKPVSVTPIDITKVKITDDPEASALRITDEFLENYPLNSKSMREGLHKKYPGLKFNHDFFVLLKKFKENKRLCLIRFLNR